MLTGLPKSASVQELATAYEAVVRKRLQKGRHIPEILVWNPDPSENDFPLKEQAALMDEFIQREHATIPIEIVKVSEGPNELLIVYRVFVTEEQLIDEERRRDEGPGREPDGSVPPKAAEMPLGPILFGAILSGGFAWWILPKDGKLTPRFLVSATAAFLGGSFAGVATRRKQEQQQG